MLLKVDGGWGEWYAWSECSVACGEGEIRRNRTCDNPAPQQGGTCRGTNSETETCNGLTCPGKLIRLQLYNPSLKLLLIFGYIAYHNKFVI